MKASAQDARQDTPTLGKQAAPSSQEHKNIWQTIELQQQPRYQPYQQTMEIYT